MNNSLSNPYAVPTPTQAKRIQTLEEDIERAHLEIERAQEEIDAIVAYEAPRFIEIDGEEIPYSS